MDYRQRLKQILCERSIKRGEFILSSGRKSDYYLDVRLTTLDPEGAYCVGMVLLDLLKTFQPYPKAIGGPTLGADPIVAVVAALSHQQAQHGLGKPVSAFIVRKEPKQHGTQQLIEGWHGQPGDPVVLVEDTCTTGTSLLKAIQQALTMRWNVVAAVCLVDREEGGRQAVEGYCPFYSLFSARELLSGAPLEQPST